MTSNIPAEKAVWREYVRMIPVGQKDRAKIDIVRMTAVRSQLEHDQLGFSSKPVAHCGGPKITIAPNIPSLYCAL